MENNVIFTFKTVIAAIGGICGMFWGKLDGAMLALLVFISIDYITGLMVGITTKTLNSSTGFKGLAKKVFILLLVLIANILDNYVISGAGVVRGVVIAFYIANEGISIMENAGKLGVPYPQSLKDILEQLKESEDDNANKL